ncbi:MAG: lysylphosphatidylglycerol synthase transmembrane domain-containing protein [Deltaproteobacteria bacterium]|nr:lysylphosphatidylglycerol synthase transmembrane domain-containing protein [Deltaproteobacteria bacterium]
MARILARLGLSAAIAGGLFFWLVNQGFHVVPSWEAVRSCTAWWAVPAYAIIFSAFNWLRAWRWIYLLKPFAKVPAGTMMEGAFAGFLAIQMMPLRTGEVARPYLLDRYAGVSKSAVFGTIAIERVVDGLLVSVWLTVALFLIPASRGPHVWALRLVPLAVFAAAMVLLVAFERSPEWTSRLVARGVGLFSKRLADFTSGVLERFHKGLGALPDRRGFWAFSAVSVLYWGLNAVAFDVLARGCGLDIGLVGAVAGMGVLAVGILLPSGPGYFGNFQVSLIAALAMFLPGGAAGSNVEVFIFLNYVLQTGLTIVFGLGAALSLRRRPVVHRARIAESAEEV